MPYASGRIFFDADSHLMETEDWLAPYADPSVRDRLRPLGFDRGNEIVAKVIAVAEKRLADKDEEATRLLEMDVIGSRAKGWLALGAIDRGERSRTIDLLGFHSQLVFPTFGITQFGRADDLDVLYGGTTALNRGMADFCSCDERLLAVGYLPLADPTRAVAAASEAIELGVRALWIPSDAPDDASPAHIAFDPIWAVMEEARVPIVLHVGGGRLLPKVYHNNGRPKPKDWTGGGENLRAKDFPVLHHSPERFIACLTLDGVFERFPNLRCGAIELGASWVPGMMRNLDTALDLLGRNEPLLKELSLRPSDYVRRQVRITPLAGEDVGWLIGSAGPELFLFSSDYPHPEGSRDPVGKFEATLGDVDEAAKKRFYCENYADLMGIEVPTSP